MYLIDRALLKYSHKKSVHIYSECEVCKRGDNGASHSLRACTGEDPDEERERVERLKMLFGVDVGGENEGEGEEAGGLGLGENLERFWGGLGEGLGRVWEGLGRAWGEFWEAPLAKTRVGRRIALCAPPPHRRWAKRAKFQIQIFAEYLSSPKCSAPNA